MFVKFLHILLLLFISTTIFSQKLTVDAGPNRDICPNKTYTLGGTPTAFGGKAPYTYQWSPSNFLNSTTIANPKVTGLNTDIWYSVIVTSADTLTDTAYVFYKYDLINTFNAGMDTGYCFNQQAGVSIGAINNSNANHTFAWLPVEGLNDPTAANPIATPSITTIYTLTVSDTKCLDHSTTVTVNAYLPPLVSAPADTTLEEGQTISLIGAGATLFRWEPDYHIKYRFTDKPDVWPIVTTTYVMYTQDQHGCVASDDVVVNVVNGNTLYFYNTFTPNGDGDNDVFYIANLEKYPDNTLKIFNRYGKLIFNAVGYDNTFNGKYLGNEIPTGTYFYVLDDGIDKKYKGTVTLIR